MDRITLSRIDEELDSTAVAGLCFLCRDVIQKKWLEGVRDAKDLFSRLEERGWLDNATFLSELLNTIGRVDLVSYLETDRRQPEQTDASPSLSAYRVMLYKIYEDITEANFQKMKFLLSEELSKRSLETCKTALDVFAEMEKGDFLSERKLDKLFSVLSELDQQLASIVRHQIDCVSQQEQTRISHHHHSFKRFNPSLEPFLSVSETCSRCESLQVGETVYSDAEPVRELSSPDEIEYYALKHNPRGLCVVINNEEFSGPLLKNRNGTQQDKEALCLLFTRLGFKMVVYDDLTANDMRLTIKELSKQNFSDHDALVVCVLSHGEKGCVYGTDEEEVCLRELTQPFTRERAPTLAGKPKLFFIQACQGSGYQKGAMVEGYKQTRVEDDAGRVSITTVPLGPDFLLGMATLSEYKSFRNTVTGSIYIQELCRQLKESAESSRRDDILTILTQVNSKVSEGDYLNHKQMPEPQYTLTKKLVLKYVN